MYTPIAFFERTSLRKRAAQTMLAKKKRVLCSNLCAKSDDWKLQRRTVSVCITFQSPLFRKMTDRYAMIGKTFYLLFMKGAPSLT